MASHQVAGYCYELLAWRGRMRIIIIIIIEGRDWIPWWRKRLLLFVCLFACLLDRLARMDISTSIIIRTYQLQTVIHTRCFHCSSFSPILYPPRSPCSLISNSPFDSHPSSLIPISLFPLPGHLFLSLFPLFTYLFSSSSFSCLVFPCLVPPFLFFPFTFIYNFLSLLHAHFLYPFSPSPSPSLP